MHVLRYSFENNQIKQSRSNTIYIFEKKKLYCQIRNGWENFSVKSILK